MSVEKILGRHSLGTMQASGNNVGSVLRGCRRKAGFTCDSRVIEKQTNKPPPPPRKKKKKKKKTKKTYLDSCVDIAIYCFSTSTTASVNRPIRLTQCCTQFKSPGVKIHCVLYLHHNVAFSFKCMEIPETKSFIPKGFELGTTLS